MIESFFKTISPELIGITIGFLIRHFMMPIISGRETGELLKYLKQTQLTKSEQYDLISNTNELKHIIEIQCLTCPYIKNKIKKDKLYYKKMTRSEFERKVDNFFAGHDDKPLDYDGAYGNQCKDVFSAFNSEVVGNQNYIYGNAYELWETIPEALYERIANTPEGVPQKGDVIIWSEKIGKNGHCAIGKGTGDQNTFESFDENFPVGSICHFQKHDYHAVLGWFRPKTQDNEPPQSTTQPQNNVAEPKYLFNRNLYPGIMHDEEVTKLQTYLKQKGCFNYPKPTGNYLSITKAGVAKFQVEHGIVASVTAYGAGHFGPRTREFVNKN